MVHRQRHLVSLILAPFGRHQEFAFGKVGVSEPLVVHPNINTPDIPSEPGKYTVLVVSIEIPLGPNLSLRNSL